MKCVKIKSIKKLPNKLDRYDLTVSSTNNFFANGILIHNTSFIVGNIKVKEPKTYTGIFGNLRTYINKKIVPSKYRKYDEVYDDVYSSRTVIKNQYLNENAGAGFYGSDIWGEYQQKLKGHIPEGMTLYGEIVGYLTGSESMIQKNYDYGCSAGENRLMIYRITTDEDGAKREWEVDEVIKWIDALVNEDTDHWEGILMPYTLLYHGTLRNLYPEIEVDEHWHENTLEALKKEKRFLMEKKEPLCKSSVPREGIVIRIANDPMKEAFKLKCSKFLEMEGKLMDAGEVDIEMADRY